MFILFTYLTRLDLKHKIGLESHGKKRYKYGNG